MEHKNFNQISWNDFQWLNEPAKWSSTNETLKVQTDANTDFWQETWYKFRRHTGHIYGSNIKDDFTFEVCIEADFQKLYDQAGLMIVLDEKRWLKAGIEFNDGQPMIGSVLTNETSDWATGIFPGDPRKFWLRLTKVDTVLCVKYSCDSITWNLLRLCPFPGQGDVNPFVGVMCCSPERQGLAVSFKGLTLNAPVKDILHSN